MEYCRWPVWNKNFLWEGAAPWWHPHHKGFIANHWESKAASKLYGPFFVLDTGQWWWDFPLLRPLNTSNKIQYGLYPPLQKSIHIMNYFSPNLSTQNPLTPQKKSRLPSARSFCARRRALRKLREFGCGAHDLIDGLPFHGTSQSLEVSGAVARIEGCLEDYPI